MTEPLPKPPRRDPQRKTPAPLVPPQPRSRAARALAAVAATGVFRLQTCAACGAVQWPPRDLCRLCLGGDLPWRAVSPLGEIVAESTVRASIDPYFRGRTPWPVCTVRLPEAGVSVIAHRHGDARGPVRLALKLDKGGQAVMIALPAEDTPAMEDDPALRDLTAHPKHRRCLVTDGRSAVGQAVARALRDAGAAEVFAGVAEGWRPFPGQDALAEMAEIVPLDLTDSRSVAAAAGAIGAKVDILVNTAQHIRPGGLDAVTVARDALDANALGLMRLARSFGPIMAARGADGTDSAAAFLSVQSVHGLVNDGEGFGAFNVSQAAALSVLQALRVDLRRGGVRVMQVLAGPLDDPWHEHVPPPKVAPKRLAAAVVDALVQGREETVVGEVAAEIAERWRADPKAAEREGAAWTS